MPFTQGMSGNPEGRPKGAKNRTGLQLRQTISDFLESNFEKITQDFEELKPAERIRYYCDLLQYGLPRLQSVQIESDFERLTDSQLDQIIDELKNTGNESEN